MKTILRIKVLTRINFLKIFANIGNQNSKFIYCIGVKSAKSTITDCNYKIKLQRNKIHHF